MNHIIKKILKILGKDLDGSMLKVIFYGDSVWLEIYENPVTIIINKKNEEVYVETDEHKLCSDMLNELSQICRLVEDNIRVFLDCLED